MLHVYKKVIYFIWLRLLMAYSYKPSIKKTRGLFDPLSEKPFKLSRSKIDLYIECKRCFYLDRKIGIARPPMLPFTLNNAVDTLLKKEFDAYRVDKKPHPLMEQYKIQALPFEHESLDVWRENFQGMQYHHLDTNFVITGAIDDIWQHANGKLIIVDYKATSSQKVFTKSSDLYPGYLRQLQIYQWLFDAAGFPISDTAVIVHYNGDSSSVSFENSLSFVPHIIPCIGEYDWVDGVLFDISELLNGSEMPEYSSECMHCEYAKCTQENELKKM